MGLSGKSCKVEGIYVPAFYDVTYKEDGTIDSFVPGKSNAKKIEACLWI